MHSEESGGPSHRRIVTIGVYGFTEAAFFQALLDAGVDSFCDVRARRGVRGSRYAFSNSRRLQARLADLGIEYHHFPNLAPTAEIREIQKTAAFTHAAPKEARRRCASRPCLTSDPVYGNRRRASANVKGAIDLDAVGGRRMGQRRVLCWLGAGPPAGGRVGARVSPC